jgi:small-conductance mechanosensitive channel
MWDKIYYNFTCIAKNNSYSKIIVTLSIILGAVILTKITAISLYRLQKKIINKLERAGVRRSSSVETRITIIRRIVEVGIYFFAFVIFLQQFEPLKHIGKGLLASAGIAGIAIGLAAQNTLSNLIAGIFISFSAPVRIKDAVIFRNDFGWIEEILLMHTVIKTWDNRRVIIPNSLLANEVIENWTVRDPTLLGAVTVYVDYACDVDKVKIWVKEIVDASPYSSKEKLAVVQVVDFTEKSMVLRILGKGEDAPGTWNLRCEIREKLIQRFKREDVPLPQIRINSEKFNVKG